MQEVCHDILLLFRFVVDLWCDWCWARIHWSRISASGIYGYGNPGRWEFRWWANSLRCEYIYTGLCI